MTTSPSSRSGTAGDPGHDDGAATLQGGGGEFGLIGRLFAPLYRRELHSEFDVGIGDDAAVMTVPRTQQLLTTVDTLVEGIHFASTADPFVLGQKAVRVNVSDIVAMGGVPHWYLLSIAMPVSTPLGWAEAFARGLSHAAQEYQLSLIGGDTVASTGGITITVTLLGLVGQQRAVLRSTAKAGDRIFISGTPGDAALGLALRTGALEPRGLSPEAQAYLKGRHDLPEPRLMVGRMLQDAALAHAAIDISDGLIADLGHVCTGSGLGAVLQLDHVPLSPAATALRQHYGEALDVWLLTGGEDYELLFTVPEIAVGQVLGIAERCQVPLTDIGVMVAGDPVVTLMRGEQSVPLKASELFARTGWSHF
jgi:thiamine-monophosphate kinase